VEGHWLALHTVPAKGWKLAFHGHALKANAGTDALYRANGAPIRTPGAGQSGGTDFGKELDVILDRKVNAHWNVQAGFGQFLSGTYLASVPPAGSTASAGPSDDVTYFYLMSTVAF
jgi:hypothetical protein